MSGDPSALMRAALAAMVDDETAPNVCRVWRDPGTLYRRASGLIPTLRALEARGLVEQVPDRPDYLRVTDAGRHLLTADDLARAAAARAVP